MSGHRFQVSLAAQFDLDAAIAEFRAAVARRGNTVINHELNDACRRARGKAEDAFGRVLDQYQYAVEEMLKPKAERKAG